MQLQLECDCGQVQGTLRHIRAGTVNRVICYCRFCQSYLRYLGREAKIPDALGGTDLFQVSPRDLQIDQGAEHIHALKLTGRGAARYYAGCCNTPLVNGMQNLSIPFVGVLAHAIKGFDNDRTRDDALGPVRARVNCQTDAQRALPKTDRVSNVVMVAHFMRLMVLWIVRRDARLSPFRYPDGSPRFPVERIEVPR